jgi:hypothetical protein
VNNTAKDLFVSVHGDTKVQSTMLIDLKMRKTRILADEVFWFLSVWRVFSILACGNVGGHMT